VLSLEEPGALKGQFGFVLSDSHFNLPSTNIRRYDEPGVLRVTDRLGG
jgi:hypothetical protein